jgi:hypothetical protein
MLKSMNSRTIRPALFFLAAVPLLLFAVGCTQTQSYDLSVRNDTPQPITIWLTKDGPEDEPAWRSPEVVAIGQATGHGGRIAGVVVAPGKIAHTNIQGQFASDTRAILRFYRGQLQLNQILAISRDSPDRLDIYLPPGPSHIIVRDTPDGRFAITPVKSFDTEAPMDKMPSG